MGYDKPYNKAYYNILYNLNNQVSDVHLRSWQGEASEALCSAFFVTCECSKLTNLLGKT